MPNLSRCLVVPFVPLLLAARMPFAEAAATADVAHGRTIAEKGPAEGVKPCASCHGANGEGNAADGQPRLAGQNAAYLKAQLAAFRAGDRANTKMTPIAKALNASDIADVSAYYASLPALDAPKAAAHTAQISDGEYLALRGDWTHDIPPCASCHGVTGRGVGATVPPLAHQPAAYLARQMHAWKDGTRRGEPLGVMQASARRTSDAQIAAVSAYYETQSDAAAKADADSSLAEPKTDAVTAKSNAFVSPPNSAIPDNNFGSMVKRGEAIFRHTGAHAGGFVGNPLTCASCHLDGGRRADSAPLGQAYVLYPAYRAKTGQVDTYAERLQGCFRYSMNGKAPPLGDPVLVALETYSYFLAKGAPTGERLPGASYPELPKLSFDLARGAKVFTAKCAVCHGADGQGQTAGGATIFPALWGADSFNWGAGMATINNAAGFIKANMPLGVAGSLSDQQAWDVAAFVDSQERPQDPRFDGDVAATRKQFHDTPMSLYGTTIGGVLLGIGVHPAARAADRASAK